jgi:hypothetical protein
MHRHASVLFALGILAAFGAHAQQADSPYYLRQGEQPHFKNDNNGQNDMERIDNNVRELNRLIGELKAMKAELAALNQRVRVLETAAEKTAVK